MIGGRIFDYTVLVGFVLGRSVYVLAAGKLACPGCAAPLRCAAGYVPPRGAPSRCGPRPPSAPTPETRCSAPSRRSTPPLADAVEAMGQLAAAHARRFVASLPAWQLICWFAAGLLLAPVPAGVQSKVQLRAASPGSKSQPTAAARRAPDPHGDCPVWNMPSVLTRPELQDGAGDRSHFNEPRFSRDRMRAAVWSGSSATSLMERNSWMYASPRPHPSRDRGCSGDPQRRQDHDLGRGEIS